MRPAPRDNHREFANADVDNKWRQRRGEERVRWWNCSYNKCQVRADFNWIAKYATKSQRLRETTRIAICYQYILFLFLIYDFICFILVIFLYGRKKRQTESWFIAPRTKWCGKGRSAENYHELGPSKGDVCCRKHDHCRMSIPAFRSKFGLFNQSPFAMSHCRCDRRFVVVFVLW